MLPKPSREEMLAALTDPDLTNPLAAAIAAVITTYGALLREQAKHEDALPKLFLVPRPRNEIEMFACEAFTREVALLGLNVKIRSDK